MSIFTLPATVPADAILGDGYALQWIENEHLDEDGVEVQFFTPIDGLLASGYGATPADAMCGLLSAFPDSDEVRLPACVAAALNELGHQAIDLVCNRLSGGTMDEATFADAPEGYVGHLCADDESSAEIDLRENEVADDECPACGGNGLDIPYAAGCGRCGA